MSGAAGCSISRWYVRPRTLNFFYIFTVVRINSKSSSMGQHLIIILLFFAALVYLGFLIYRSFRSRRGCSSGCGSCGVDFNKIQKEIREKSV